MQGVQAGVEATNRRRLELHSARFIEQRAMNLALSDSVGLASVLVLRERELTRSATELGGYALAD